MPKVLNNVLKLSKKDYILISHNDFYYCPGWDEELLKNINSINHKNLIFNNYDGPLTDPHKNISYYLEPIKVKFQLIYLKIVNYK